MHDFCICLNVSDIYDFADSVADLGRFDILLDENILLIGLMQSCVPRNVICVRCLTSNNEYLALSWTAWILQILVFLPTCGLVTVVSRPCVGLILRITNTYRSYIFMWCFSHLSCTKYPVVFLIWKHMTWPVFDKDGPMCTRCICRTTLKRMCSAFVNHAVCYLVPKVSNSVKPGNS